MPPPPFPPPATWLSCPRCRVPVPCYDPVGSRWVGCFRCRAFFPAGRVVVAPPELPPLGGFRWQVAAGPSLALGAVAELGGHRCRVVGYQVRGEQHDPRAEWHEYRLRPAGPPEAPLPVDFPLYLTEHRGHWLLGRPAPEYAAVLAPRPTQDGRYEDETGRQYRIWRRYQPVVRDARGEFGHDVRADAGLHLAEYAAPPYLLVSTEAPGAAPTWHRAEHLARAQVAAAFGLPASALPLPQGVGAAQPGPARQSWPALRRLADAGALLLTLLQLALLGLRPTHLGVQDFLVNEPDPGRPGWPLASSPLVLAGPQALQVTLTAFDLQGHWLLVRALLVNEQTGRRYAFARRLAATEPAPSYAFNPGYQTSAQVVLSGVPAGRYHFQLLPTLDPGTGAIALRLTVETPVPLWSNYLLLLGLVLLPPLVVWVRHNQFERARWRNNVYSPYLAT